MHGIGLTQPLKKTSVKTGKVSFLPQFFIKNVPISEVVRRTVTVKTRDKGDGDS